MMQNAQARRVFWYVLAVFAGLVALRSGFDFAKHETEMLHLIDIVLRLERGAKLHEDVMPPLGLWSVAPFVLLKQAGLGLGAGAGLAGEPAYVAGLFNTLWMFGDFVPLTGGAPWYYGGLPGIENARIFVLPECSFKPDFKELVMQEITRRGIGLVPLYQDDVLAAFRLQLPK